FTTFRFEKRNCRLAALAVSRVRRGRLPVNSDKNLAARQAALSINGVARYAGAALPKKALHLANSSLCGIFTLLNKNRCPVTAGLSINNIITLAVSSTSMRPTEPLG